MSKSTASKYVFEHVLNAQTRLNRAHIEKEGGKLLSQLEALQHEHQIARVLMPHSLGGLVLKRALSMAHQQGKPPGLNGNNIIIFSCPNFELGTTVGGSSLVSIAKEYAKFHLSTQGANALLPDPGHDAKHFLEAVESIPVCLVYEKKLTTVTKGDLGRDSVVRRLAPSSCSSNRRLASH